MINVRKNTDLGLLWLRLIMGLAIAYHGSTKVFGDMQGMIEGVGRLGFPVPFVFAWAAALSEFVGGLLIAVGGLTRIAASLVFITMSVAFFGVHANDPFQVKELAMMFGAIAGALIFTGAGKYSLDSRFCKHE